MGNLLGFNLQDLAETDIFNVYLKSIFDYNLISKSEEIIYLTKFGQEALQSKLKYKYIFASTELFENQTVIGESFDFSFKTTFDLDNRLSSLSDNPKKVSDDIETKQKLQFQLFENDIYKGEIIELYESNPQFSYKEITLFCETYELNNTFQLSINKSGVNKPDIQFLIEFTENEEFKNKLIRKGMYHHILAENSLITAQDIEIYKDLWNWKELAENPKTDWNDKTVFKLFVENEDVSIWSIISEKAPIESIKSVITEYTEYWNWATLTEKFDNDFIKEQIENCNWDFEELSYKETEFVQSLLLNLALKDRDWDWNYLSKNLTDKFVEEHIEDFAWDFYIITEVKSSILKKLLAKGNKSNAEFANVLLSKPWNWKFISEKFEVKFLYNQISSLAEKVDWHIVLEKFFNNEEITSNCLKNDKFKSLLKQHLPDAFIIAHQKYLWTLDLIYFFEEQNLIQWETKTYIQGFDTNENIEWDKLVFEKYHTRITTERGFLNVSQHISDYSLIEQFPDFTWDWKGISKNKNLNTNADFITKAFTGKLQFTKNLLWNEILDSITKIQFLNNHLDTFYNNTVDTNQIEFWKSLTQKESQDYIFANLHFPWDWSYITENVTEEIIIDSLDNEELLGKWDWSIATKKLDKESLLFYLEDLAHFVDWQFLINEVFKPENELSIDNELPRIAACLSVLVEAKRKLIWSIITRVYSFEILFNYVTQTSQFEAFEWDWKYISSHNFFSTSMEILILFKDKINWEALSSNRSIHQKFRFRKEEWKNYTEYYDYILGYLIEFKEFWDWNILSKNTGLNYNRELVYKFRLKWNWDYLSEYGGFLIEKKKDNGNYLQDLITKFPFVKFEFLSKRMDINIESDLILANKNKNWDWQILSENKKAKISKEIILELKDKNWNWKVLSKRKIIEFSNELLLQLLEKDWDWSYFSENKNLKFSVDFIEKTKGKPWNWKAISRHETFLPTVEILTLTKDFDLDWKYLSEHPKLNPTKEILAKFEDKWHWQSITENLKINFSEIDFIERFSAKWNWHFICESGKITLNNQILKKFKGHLEWNLISSNNNIDFTEEIIQEFKQYWNWTALKGNKRVEELLGSYVYDEIVNDPILQFIDKITEQKSPWKECVFHFANIDNAVKIIKEGKIKSRKTANQLSNSSGKLTYKTRKNPEKFARFYFRTDTPTQYYNEGLFEPNNNEKYRELGYPKCPIMIYFKISLQELIFKNRSYLNTFLSNGNMQRSRTKYGRIEDMINNFFYNELFYGNEFDEINGFYSQQELMFQTEVSILNLSSLEVIVQKECDKELLERMLGDDCSKFKIRVERNLYKCANDRPLIEINEVEVSISSKNKQQGYFLAYFDNFIPKVTEGNIIKIDELKKVIYFKSHLKFPKTFQNFQIDFFEEIENVKQNWILATQTEFKYEHSTYKRKYI